MTKENIDVSTGDYFPVNGEEQGKVFIIFKELMNHMRYNQLIKKVKYKIEIEYYPKAKDD